MEEYVAEALAQGYIEHSTSLASAEFFFVEKKGCSLCPCIDYHGLNQITMKYPYPLPLVPTALKQLRNARIFTKLDQRNAYNLIRIRKGDEWKAAFSITSGHYQYKVMPYGLAYVPSVCLINDALCEFLERFVIAYRHILIYSPSKETHVNHVKRVLERLRMNQLYVKGEKCEFHVETVTFLGYIISAYRIKMDYDKLHAIRDWPAPKSVKELQRFLGFANFYWHFIRDYSLITAPLTSMLKRMLRGLYRLEQQKKHSLTSRRHLHLPQSYNTLIWKNPSSWR